jgi:hypothetical protein
MTMTAEQVEHALRGDLQRLAKRFADQDLWEGLYRTLGNRTWYHQARPEGHAALSWERTEELVNALRARAGLEPIELAQTGSEGLPDPRVAGELERLGWRSTPLDATRPDDADLDGPEDELRTPPSMPIARHRD